MLEVREDMSLFALMVVNTKTKKQNVFLDAKSMVISQYRMIGRFDVVATAPNAIQEEIEQKKRWKR